jgi:hypothetical protein
VQSAQSAQSTQSAQSVPLMFKGSASSGATLEQNTTLLQQSSTFHTQTHKTMCKFGSTQAYVAADVPAVRQQRVCEAEAHRRVVRPLARFQQQLVVRPEVGSVGHPEAWPAPCLVLRHGFLRHVVCAVMKRVCSTRMQVWRAVFARVEKVLQEGFARMVFKGVLQEDHSAHSADNPTHVVLKDSRAELYEV